MTPYTSIPPLRSGGNIRPPSVALIPEDQWQREQALAEHRLVQSILWHKRYCFIATYFSLFILIANAGALAYLQLPAWRWFLFAAALVWIMEILCGTSSLPAVRARKVDVKNAQRAGTTHPLPVGRD